MDIEIDEMTVDHGRVILNLRADGIETVRVDLDEILSELKPDDVLASLRPEVIAEFVNNDDDIRAMIHPPQTVIDSAMLHDWLAQSDANIRTTLAVLLAVITGTKVAGVGGGA